MSNEFGNKSDRARSSQEVSDHHLILRNTRLEDYGDVGEIMDRVYPQLGGSWSYDRFAAQINRFPEGQICIEDNGKVVAASNTLIVAYDRFGDQHTYETITADGWFSTHDPAGDTLYGADIFVHPDYRGLRLGRRLYDARKALCQRLNLKRMVAGGRIPGYRDYANKMTPLEYIQLVKDKELRDSVLTFQLANDFHVRKVIHDYEPRDRDSRSYATLLEWINIHYREKPVAVGSVKPTVRVSAVQWQMRQADSFEQLLSQVEYFIDVVAGYKSDFVVFPEFFNMPLMVRFNQDNPAEAIRELAGYTDRFRDEMQKMAISYNVNIIAGSMPVYENQTLHNVSFLLRRDGTRESQYKLHITPDETAYWGLKGGNALQVHETDAGRVGILICYDVEFPELPRLMADKGLQLLFVPYWTDTKNAYERVRRCAQARAIENECYVIITGSVGNLPNVENMDIQYSQSAVFTPSDYAFAHDAIAAEATPNTEMTLIADLDLNKLTELRRQGSVRNLQDRRLDLYGIKWI